ncbi:bidirectional sugar transporter SWEET, partial [Haematococcus lacustris]
MIADDWKSLALNHLAPGLGCIIAFLMGYQAVGVLLLYYSAPLSTLAEVLRTRSAASLHAPLSAMSCVNGSLWVAYGLAVGDAFIWAPNAVGAVFGALQLLLLAIFPRTSSAIAVLQHDIREPLVDA